MDNVSFIEQEFCKVSAILTSGSGDQSYAFRHACSVSNLATSFHTRSPAAVSTIRNMCSSLQKFSGQARRGIHAAARRALAEWFLTALTAGGRLHFLDPTCVLMTFKYKL